jgi:hypothetical protein
MPSRLHAHARLELCWWWEGAPAGERLLFSDRDAACRLVASLHARPENQAALRRLLHQGAPGLWAAPDADELVARLGTALATGRLKVGQLPADRLSTWSGPREEEAAASSPAPIAAPLPPAEEICWPCLRAAASARALREASADGAPFVAQD